ncbi:MAG: type III pantothenate kinase [Muribaculaceae bacterium]|nr:type III pantothenate kinase [Muribaculaceae bacterium]
MGSAFLAIDCGNSRLKTTLFQDSVCVETTAFDSKDIEGVLLYMESRGVDSAAMVSVGHTDVRMVETVRQAVDDRFLLLTHNTPLPIVIGYDTPETLGLDRVAAAAGAYSLYSGRTCVVADAGTALTVDLLDAEGTFWGGTISPGISMQFRALHEGTHSLPEVSLRDYPVDAGGKVPGNTRTAIAVGVVDGMVDRLYCARRPGTVMVVTGGDGDLLYRKLMEREHPDGMDIVYIPYLVALGLKYIFDEYEKGI